MAVLAGYNGAIVTKQGASAMTFASGASLTIAAGAALTLAGSLNMATGGFNASTTIVQTSGSVQIGTGGSLIVKPEATTINNPTVVLQMGRNQMWYMAGSAACPLFSASPGDLLWLSNSASTDLYINRSDGPTGASIWLAVRLATGSQILGE